MPKLYVGTYAKYNNGDLSGEWMDLSDYNDKDEFLEACAELHSDEEDPEFMFQDKEDIPEGMYSESSVEDAIWDFLNMSDDDQELLKVYRENVDSDASIETAREAFLGKYNSPEDWAESFLEETGGLAEVPASLRMYIDFASWANDARCGGDMTFVETGYHECWCFHN